MKLSFNFRHDDNNNPNPRLKAKLPISIFDQPFTSTLTTATNSSDHLSFSLSTAFPSGPSLKLTYSPLSSAAAAAGSSSSSSPFSLSVKSGLGLFGSPQNSPLVFSANFCFSNASSNAIMPTFSLHFKPQLGHFSLHKKADPSSNPNPDANTGTHFVTGSKSNDGSPSNSEFGNRFSSDGSLGWQEVKLEPLSGKEKGFACANPNDYNGDYSHNSGIRFLPDNQLMFGAGKRGGFVSGVAVKTKTVLPFTKRFEVNLRWDVNLPGDMCTKMPYLTVDKIALQRIQEVKEIKEKSNVNNTGDVELLKGMCFWMRRDLEIMEKENRDLKQCLEDMKLRVSARNSRWMTSGKASVPASSYKLEEFHLQNGKKNGESGQMEVKKPADLVTDLESELQKAIKAAAS